MWSESGAERMDGLQLRLATTSAWLGQIGERLGRAPRVLDYGAGTGALLTLPLARCRPDLSITAFDVSPRNIGRLRALASRRALPNLYASWQRNDLGACAPFDVIICADVLEHLPDPETVLRDMHSLLSPRGWLIVSVPNGFGCFEIGTFIRDLLWISGLRPRTRGGLRRGRPPAPAPDDGAATADTLEIDPHLQFYTVRALRSLLNRAGFEIAARRNRMFLGGFPF
jgi:SAM-dependent methyltransferase